VRGVWKDETWLMKGLWPIDGKIGSEEGPGGNQIASLIKNKKNESKQWEKRVGMAGNNSKKLT